MPSSRGSSQPRDWTQVSLIAGRFFTDWATRKVKSLSPVRLSAALWTVAHQAPPIHGILQARVLEWVASSFSRGSSQPTDWTQVSLIAGRCFNLWAREALNYINLDLYSCVKMLRASRFYEDCSFFLRLAYLNFRSSISFFLKLWKHWNECHYTSLNCNHNTSHLTSTVLYTLLIHSGYRKLFTV